MKITDVKIIRASRYLFLNVETDEGITGLGEAGIWAFPNSTIEAVLQFREGLIGADPMNTEYIWQAMYRSGYFRGSIITSAISAIDIALWDIKGKKLGVPVYKLLGGLYRDKARVYAPLFKFTAPEMAHGCVELQRQGFSAARLMLTHVKQTEPMSAETSIHCNRVSEAIEMVRACREAVGDKFDLCIEVHRSMNPAEAAAFCKGIESYHPMFVEDPICPDTIGAYRFLTSKTVIPIATGERFFHIAEFEALLEEGGAQYIRPDLCVMGGITAGKKVAAIAEARGVGIIPHNPLGPVSTAVCLQLDACIPNFSIQEFPSYYMEDGEKEMIKEEFELENGYLKLPEKPGIGIELIPDIVKKFPPCGNRSAFHIQKDYDGSVRDL